VGSCPIDLDPVSRATACTIVRTPSLVLAFEVTRVGKAMASERGLKFTAAKTSDYVGSTLDWLHRLRDRLLRHDR